MITEAQLVQKLDNARRDFTDGCMTIREYLDHVSAIMDGDVDWALGGNPSRRIDPIVHLGRHTVRLRL